MSARITQSSAGQRRTAASHDLMTGAVNRATSGETADFDHSIGSALQVAGAIMVAQIRAGGEFRHICRSPSGQQSRRTLLIEHQGGLS